MKRLTQYLTFFAAAAMTAPAFCAGVTLINQSTVLTSGGFPYVIGQSGSYQLSSNLVVPCGTALTGISITASYVTLDLDGFTLSCQSTPNAATGILITGLGVTIMNGAIQGFGAARRSSNGPPSGSAITILPTTYGPDKVDHVRMDQNGIGITEFGSNIEVTDSSVTNSLGQGINSEGLLRLANSSIFNNQGGGVNMSNGLVTGNMIVTNGAYGISVNETANITNNDILQNTIGVVGQAGPGSPVGVGMNTFSLNSTDLSGGCVSMKNNVNSLGQLF